MQISQLNKKNMYIINGLMNEWGEMNVLNVVPDFSISNFEKWIWWMCRCWQSSPCSKPWTGHNTNFFSFCHTTTRQLLLRKKIGGLVNDETPRFPHQPPQKYHQTTSVEKKIGGGWSGAWVDWWMMLSSKMCVTPSQYQESDSGPWFAWVLRSWGGHCKGHS